jgi:hypothetical protein
LVRYAFGLKSYYCGPRRRHILVSRPLLQQTLRGGEGFF